VIIPAITLELAPPALAEDVGVEVDVRDVPTRITNRTFRVTLTLSTRGLFTADTITIRAAIISSDGREIGSVGQTIDAGFDPVSKNVTVGIGRTATLLMLLQRDDAPDASVVIEDATTKALLYRSPTPLAIDVL
jgi:hypothetical protein